MAYIDEGAGSAIVFQHGNPTSSYLWRNVMPHCAGLGRLIACDLIGMGGRRSCRIPVLTLRVQEQREFLFALWNKLDLGNDVILVIHDWGSVLGFDWAARIPSGQRIVYMEAVVKPLTWQDWPRVRARFSRASAASAVMKWFLRRTFSSSGCCQARYCAA